MKQKIFVVITCLLFVQQLPAQTDTILNRYKQYLFATVQPAATVEQFVTSLNNIGQWNDINYNDKEWGNWKPLNHLRRVRDMAFAYSNPQSPFYHQQKFLQSISLSLDHWFREKYQCPNWWHNEIGVPQQMRDIIILLRTDLTPVQMKAALEILNQYKINNQSAGANLTWSADLGLHYGLLTGNNELAKSCAEKIIAEIKITTKDGVQPDYSFHQHEQRLQMYQYGAAFFRENVRIAWQLRNTELAFPTEKINLLTDFLLKGWQWMTRGIHTVPGTMDRSASRKDALHSSDIRPLIPFLIELIPAKKSELIAIADHQNGIGALSGFQYYPYSDFTAYQQSDFSFFLKTISSRTLPTESINKENFKGHLLNSGDAYLIKNGDEYFNMMPLWNWEYLPGVTSFKGADKVKRKPFAGSVGNGINGFTVMDYFLESKDAACSVSAKKSWFCYDNKIMCLVADLKMNNVDSAYTAIDQCRWLGDVTVNNRKKNLTDGNHFFERLKWVYHHGFVYVPLTNTNAVIQLHNVINQWSAINTSESEDTVQGKIFMPVLLHTNAAKPQSFAYLMTHCSNVSNAKQIARNKNFKIIRNDSLCQAILFSDGTVMAAFFNSGSISFNKKIISADKPCLIMLHNDTMYVSDPQQVNKIVSVYINDKSFEVELPGNGFSTKGILVNDVKNK